MNMTGSVYWCRSDGGERKISGVYYTVQTGIEADQAGHYSRGKLIVRIPAGRKGMLPECGDQLRTADGAVWYTVTEKRDNRRPCCGLSHWKLICHG